MLAVTVQATAAVTIMFRNWRRNGTITTWWSFCCCCLARFSALEQAHCALVTWDSMWVTVAFYSMFCVCTWSGVRTACLVGTWLELISLLNRSLFPSLLTVHPSLCAVLAGEGVDSQVQQRVPGVPVEQVSLLMVDCVSRCVCSSCWRGWSPRWRCTCWTSPSSHGGLCVPLCVQFLLERVESQVEVYLLNKSLFSWWTVCPAVCAVLAGEGGVPGGGVPVEQVPLLMVDCVSRCVCSSCWRGWSPRWRWTYWTSLSAHGWLCIHLFMQFLLERVEIAKYSSVSQVEVLMCLLDKSLSISVGKPTGHISRHTAALGPRFR